MLEWDHIKAENGLPHLETGMGLGGTDASYVTEAGIPCLDAFGVEGGKIHSVEEFATLASLAEAAMRIAAIALFL